MKRFNGSAVQRWSLTGIPAAILWCLTASSAAAQDAGYDRAHAGSMTQRVSESPGPQFAALLPGNGAVTFTSLLSVANLSPARFPRESPADARNYHFKVWQGYDSDIALHPYTSDMGPCPQGQGKTICTDAIPPSHYERAIFMN